MSILYKQLLAYKISTLSMFNMTRKSCNEAVILIPLGSANFQIPGMTRLVLLLGSLTNSVSQVFHLIVSMNSLSYLIKCIFIETSLSTNEISLQETVISTNDSNVLQLQNLLDVVSFIFNSVQCWHISLEQLCANKVLLSQNKSSIIHPCDNHCPWCNKSYELYIKSIIKRGFIQFLVNIFIEKNLNNITLTMLCDELKSYKTVGRTIYECRVDTAPPVIFLNSTVLQLIGSKILKLHITHNVDDNKAYMILCLNYIYDYSNEYGQLAYMIDAYWVGFSFIN